MIDDKTKVLTWDKTIQPSHEGLAILCSKLCHLYVNDQYCKMLGMSKAELMTKRLEDIICQTEVLKVIGSAQMIQSELLSNSLLMTKLINPTGQPILVSLIMSGVCSPDSSTTSFYVIKIMLRKSDTTNPTAKRSSKAFEIFKIIMDFLMRLVK